MSLRNHPLSERPFSSCALSKESHLLPIEKYFSSSFSTSLVSVYLSSFRENIPSCALSQKKKTSSSSRQILVVFFLHFLVSAYSNLRPALMSREKKKVQAFPPCTHPETLCTRYVRFFGSDLWRRKSYHSHVNM